MDIASLSTTLSQHKVMTDVSVAMLSKSMDMAEDLSAGITNMIDSAPAPSLSPAGLGTNIDVLI